MRSPVLSILVVLTAVAAVAWWVFGDRGERPASAPTPRDGTGAPAGGLPHHQAGTRAPVEGATADDAVTVLVLDADGAPVAGAEVLHTVPQAGGATRAGEAVQLWTRDRAVWTERFGRALRTDASGSVCITVSDVPEDRSGNAMYVCARHGDKFAEDFVRWRNAPGTCVVLRLAREVELVAKLLDPQGRPVPRRPLEARFTTEDEIIGPHAMTHDLGTTDDAGLVHVPHVQTWWDRVRKVAGLRRVVIAPLVPWLDDIGTDVVLERLPQEAVLVRMPPTGRIVVVVDGWEGPGAGLAHVEMRPSNAAGRRPSAAGIDGDGRAVFEPVPLGRSWSVRLASSSRIEELDGPRTDGEEVVLHIAMPTVPVLTGRLVFDGQPLADTVFQLSAEGHPALARQGGRTDDAGRFRHELTPPDIGTTLSDIRCLVLREGAADALVGRVAGERELAPGDVDLGDTVLASVPPVLTGRLVGRRKPDEVEMWVVTTDVSGASRGVPTLGVDVAPDGAFAVRGAAPASPLRLIVFAPSHAPVPPIPFVPGQRDLELVLERGGSVTLDLIVGDPRAFLTLDPRIAPTDGRPESSLQGGESAYADHEWNRAVPARPEFVDDDPETFRYVWSGVPPGRYRAGIATWGTSRPVLEIPDFVIENGGSVTLEPVDLRDLVTQITLRFPDLGELNSFDAHAAGRWSLGQVFVEEPGGLARQCYNIDSPVAFVAAHGALDLVVDARGFRRKVVRGVREDTEIRLEPGLVLDLTLASAPELPEGASLLVSATPGDGAALPSGSEVFSPAAGGSIPPYSPPSVPCIGDGATRRAIVTAPGTYELSAAIRLATSRGVPLEVSPARVQVGESGGRATVTLTRKDR